MKRQVALWMAVSLPVLSVLLQGQGCGKPAIPAQMKLTVQATGQGGVATTPGGGVYDSSAQVTLTAMPAAGWAFDHWEGDLSGKANPASLSMDANKLVTAVFVATGSDGGWAEWTETSIQADTTIPAGSYLVNSNIEVHSGVLTLAPGVTLKFAAGTSLWVGTNGALFAAGTAGSPIVLTGQTATRGFWYGVTFDDSNWAANLLDYVTIEYGGQDSPNHPANLTLQHGTRVAIGHCKLRESATYGFNFAGNSENVNVTAFDSNTIVGNALGAGHIYAWHGRFLSNTSTYKGNGVNAVIVGGGLGNNTLVEQTWPAIDVDYRIASELNVNSRLIISPGARLAFEPGTRLAVEANGKLTAGGTADRPIVFTGTQQSRGSWYGLRIHGGTTGHILNYVTIEYAGKVLGSDSAALILYDNASLAILNSTIRHSASWGIWMRGAFVNNQIETVNTFEDNVSGNIHVEP